jgi:creatinine amidohydrolase
MDCRTLTGRLPLVLAGAVLLALGAGVATAQPGPTTRELERLNWMEFRELVPAKVRTVIVPFGTVEEHGAGPNGTDILAPLAIARDIAPRVNALVAPAVPYGMTGSLDAYPGGLTIPEEAYRPYIKAVLAGLAKNRFKNIILINGHGGGQSSVLSAVAAEVGRDLNVRTLVVNWWTYCSDVTLKVFGEDGGHAGENENAFVMAIDPALVHKDRYTADMALANPPSGTWTAYPHPAPIMLYKEGQGYPMFDLAKAKQYFAAVNDKIARLVVDVIGRWDAMGL